MSDEKIAPARLAMRVEGLFWNAYCALPNTMQDAVLLGSIRMAHASVPDIKERFMVLMQDCMDQTLREIFKAEPEWNEPQSAPEHERAGRA